MRGRRDASRAFEIGSREELRIFRAIFDLGVPDHAEQEVYLRLPPIQLINRGISARRHRGHNDNAVPRLYGGSYLPFNYIAITGACVYVPYLKLRDAISATKRFNPPETFNN